MLLRRAERKKTKLKLGMSAPSGAGKTYSSLLLAKGLCGSWDKIAVLDSENGSAELYSHLGPYQVGDLKPPFDAETYLKGIRAVEKSGAEVLIIDSMTHFWDWCLEYQQKIGGRYQDWAKTNPIYESVIQAILQSPLHVITCSRRKSAYEISNENGKPKVTKIGMKSEMREGYEFELTVLFNLSQNHLAEAEKDRTMDANGRSLFKGKAEFVITEQTGILLREWAESGAEPAAILQSVSPPMNADSLAKMLTAFTSLGVTKFQLEEKCGYPSDMFTEEDGETLRLIFGDISSGKVPVTAVFPSQQASASDLNKRFGGQR